MPYGLMTPKWMFFNFIIESIIMSTDGKKYEQQGTLNIKK